MKTVKFQQTLYRFANGEVTSTELSVSKGKTVHNRGFNNFDIVAQMAANGYEPAIKDLERLKQMSSRQRSKSGIYYKLEKGQNGSNPEWLLPDSPDQWKIAFCQLAGINFSDLPKPFQVIATAEVRDDNYGRTEAVRRAFNKFDAWTNQPGNYIVETKALYSVDKISVFIMVE